MRRLIDVGFASRTAAGPQILSILTAGHIGVSDGRSPARRGDLTVGFIQNPSQNEEPEREVAHFPLGSVRKLPKTAPNSSNSGHPARMPIFAVFAVFAACLYRQMGCE
jgi:hypothetical protein